MKNQKINTIKIFACFITIYLLQFGIIKANNKTENWDEYVKFYNVSSKEMWRIRNIDPFKALEIGKKLFAKMEYHKDESKKAKILNYYGAVLIYLREDERAMDTLRKALFFAKKFKDSTEIAYSLNNMGSVYKNQSRYVEATEAVLEAKEIFTKINNIEGPAYCSIVLGLLYLQEAAYDKALMYFKESETLRLKLGDKSGLAKSYLFIGNTYFEMGKVDNAYNYYQKLLELLPTVKNQFQDAVVLAALAKLYLHKNENDKALMYAEQALKKAEGRYYDKDIVVQALLVLGKLSIAKNDLQNAEMYFVKGLKIATPLKITASILECNSELSKIYETRGNYKAALHYKNNAIIIERNLFKETRLRDINSLLAEHSVAKKEYENLILKKDNEIQQKEINEGKTRTIFLFLVLLLSLIISAGAMYALRNNTRYTKEIILQKQELEKLNDELQAVNKSKDRFFSIIAHDMKSPFQGLLGYSQLLTDEYDELENDEKKSVIKSMHSLCNNSYKLLQNLLEWSRLKTGRMEFNPEIFSLYDELSPTIKLLNQSAVNKEITIKSQINEDIVLNADKNMLQTIIRNLVFNAIKFSYQKGEILVNASGKGDNVEIIIEDNGIGIAKDKIENLFKIDKNVSTKGTANEEGTGLGLLLCKEMIDLHKGHIVVKSEENRGSVFIITLPKAI